MIGALLLCIAALATYGATLSGTVTDAAGKPLADVRVDHLSNKPPFSVFVFVGQPPLKGEVRTDADGRFELTTNVRAVVVRKPGYTSQRILNNAEASVKITLEPIQEGWPCKLSPRPQSHIKTANDVDYTANYFYTRTKNGRTIGFMSGSGPSYSFGAPSNSEVWESTEYKEVMYQRGLIEASGRSRDGKYWHSRTRFGAAESYAQATAEDADVLDCLMDRGPLK